MAKQKITAQMLDDLFVDAMSGDWEAEREYREAVRKLAKASNQQMLEQERLDVTGEAYRRAQEFLGGDPEDEKGKRFKENNAKMDINEVRAMADEILSFRSAKDYSVPYAIKSKEEIEKNAKALEAAGIDISDARVTFHMNELFKTAAWKEFRRMPYKSTDLIRAAQDAFKADKTYKDFVNAYNDYASSRDTENRIDLLQAWTKVTG